MKLSTKIIPAFAVLVLASGVVLAETTIRSSDLGSKPVKGERHEKATLKSGSVEISNVGGSVEVGATGGDIVEIDYQRSAATQQDYDCEQLKLETSSNRVRIWVESNKTSQCRNIRADDHLTVRLPRQLALSVAEIGDSVKVSGVQGLVKVAQVGDSVNLEQVRALRVGQVGDSVRAVLDGLAEDGVRISEVGDSVKLTLPAKLNARLEVDSVGDDISAKGLELSDVEKDEDGQSLRATLGKGGPQIRISSVGDSVVLRQ